MTWADSDNLHKDLMSVDKCKHKASRRVYVCLVMCSLLRKKLNLPQCSHCDDGVPETCRNTFEFCVGFSFFHVIHDSSKYDDSH